MIAWNRGVETLQAYISLPVDLSRVRYEALQGGLEYRLSAWGR